MGISKGGYGMHIIDNFWQSGFSGMWWEKTTLEVVEGWMVGKQLEASTWYVVKTHRSSVETSQTTLMCSVFAENNLKLFIH